MPCNLSSGRVIGIGQIPSGMVTHTELIQQPRQERGAERSNPCIKYLQSLISEFSFFKLSLKDSKESNNLPNWNYTLCVICEIAKLEFQWNLSCRLSLWLKSPHLQKKPYPYVNTYNIIFLITVWIRWWIQWLISGWTGMRRAGLRRTSIGFSRSCVWLGCLWVSCGWVRCLWVSCFWVRRRNETRVSMFAFFLTIRWDVEKSAVFGVYL